MTGLHDAARPGSDTVPDRAVALGWKAANSVGGIVQIVVIVLIVLFVVGYFGRGRFRA
jgi:hypothetical protein